MAAARQFSETRGDDSSLRLAVLIDADNAQAAVIDALLAEVARYGEATVKRIYGDFTAPASASWKKVLQRHAIKPVQQFAYTTGKNATDSSLIIDAMDLLYTRKFDGFCLVTSDSDFTGLAMRLREEGLTVFGFGEKKTPDAFRNACHKFVFTEVLRGPAKKAAPAAVAAPVTAATAQQPASAVAAAPASKLAKPAKPAAVPARKEKPKAAESESDARPPMPVEFLLQALEETLDDEGWANLGAFGSYLNKVQPDFDSRLYGYRKLSDLVKARPDLFVIEERELPGSKNKPVYVRARGAGS
jgi:hypothetical protein